MRCPARAAAVAASRAPRTGLISPPSDSSPYNSQLSNGGCTTCPEAMRMPSAIGKSKRTPSLRRSAGDRLTVMRPSGIRRPQLRIAACTRSLLSFTTASGKPTIAKRGRPLARWTSTRTSGASMPCCARLRTVATILGFLCGLASGPACCGPLLASHAAAAWRAAISGRFPGCEARFQRFQLLARAAQDAPPGRRIPAATPGRGARAPIAARL